ncbi:MAG: hypothetical protein V7751_08735 [Pseudoalteromonas distincta]|tara:strand:+ start:31143 stop:31724 length:582 start_codon:yes stop_codon:yes gene_type:complete
MNTIIAGRFELQDQGEEVLRALRGAGFPRDAMTLFYVNPDGQHDIYPIGGDDDDSPGARDADKGALAGGGLGAAAGLAAGAAAAAVAGPVGIAAAVGVGAYTGSLAGAVNSTNEESEVDEAAEEGENTRKLTERHAGIHVAVRVDGEGAPDDGQAIAVSTLQSHGAMDIEQAEGLLEEGNWKDFDPREVVHLV